MPDNEFPPRPELPARDEPFAPGDTAHDFTLPAVNTEAEVFSLTLSETLGDSRGLLVFYQDDGMPICTAELKAFAQEHDLLKNAGIVVVGVNTNGIGSHQRFQERDAFPFPLTSDFHGDVVKAYGMWDPDEDKSKRGVVALGPGLEVLYVEPHFNPGAISAFEGIFRALGLA
jgi:thioredoxin-dependent peroxiredoxin